MTKDYRLEIKIKNNAVLKRIEEMGYSSVVSFCRAHNLNYHSVNKIIAFQAQYYNQDGQISYVICRLADALRVPYDYIYPPERRERPLVSNSYVLEASKPDLMQISASLRTDALPVDDRKMLSDFRVTLQRLMDECLTPRQKEVLDRRFGLTSGEPETLDQIGKAMGFSGHNVRMIEAKAMRQMKHPERSRVLREYLEFLNDVQAR